MQFCAKDSCCTSPETFFRKKRDLIDAPLASVLHAASPQLPGADALLRRCSICGLLSNVRQVLDRCRNR